MPNYKIQLRISPNPSRILFAVLLGLCFYLSSNAAIPYCFKTFDSNRYVSVDLNLTQRMSQWRTFLKEARKRRDPPTSAEILGRISTYAANLLREKRNSEFYQLVAEFPFPMKRILLLLMKTIWAIYDFR